jgi:hypothetical protein
MPGPPEAVAIKFLDLQFERDDQRQVAELLRPSGGDIGALGQELCLERIDFVRR